MSSLPLYSLAGLSQWWTPTAIYARGTVSTVRRWQRGEQHAWRERKAKEGGESRCWGVKIHYIHRLAGYPSGTASHFLSTFPHFLLLLSVLHLFYQQNDFQTNKNRLRQLTTGQNTRLRLTKHTRRDNPHPSPMPPIFFPVSFPAPCNLHAHACPFPETKWHEINKKSTTK